jgi:predicted DCC family thiol-disulfide oxidoreductase YuxK|tara:strand:+ start:167 stop:547 length:381 start_codon:yes stop_codon:yes gene_type:complete
MKKIIYIITIMKVYFNNSCKICKAEIDLYKKEEISEINWVDITNNKQAKIETKKNFKELLRRLHVEKNGEIFSGAKAFLLVWKNIPKYKFLYKIFSLPIIFQIFSVGYEIIAFFLYLKNKKQIKTN